MASLFIAYRYVVFVLFVLCSAITIGIAAWNLGLAKTLLLSNSSTAVDGFLIFVGVLGTVCLFPIMFIDLLRKNVFTSQVRFESALMGVFWLLQITGAAAMTITKVNSTVICLPASPQASLEYCTSSTVLLVFSWISAANSLFYFCILMVLAIMRYSEDPMVWKTSTLEYPWVGTGESLGTAAPVPPVPTKKGRKPFMLSRTSFAGRMFASQQMSDPEKQVQPQPTSAAMPQPTVPRMRQGSNEPRPSLAAQRPTPAQSSRKFEHTRTMSQDSVSSASSSSSGSSGYTSSDAGLLSPASNPRHAHRHKRSLHRPPPLDLTLVTSSRTARPAANQQ